MIGLSAFFLGIHAKIRWDVHVHVLRVHVRTCVYTLEHHECMGSSERPFICCHELRLTAIDVVENSFSPIVLTVVAPTVVA